MLKSLVVVVMLAFSSFGQQHPVLEGTWTGTSGPKTVYRGGWSARLVAATPNTVQGSWVLTDAANKVTLQGTWAAEKSPRGWQGTWSARIVTDRTSAGRLITGTWQASIKDSSIKSLTGMLRQTLKEEVSGSWRSGGYQGHWWLKGTRESTGGSAFLTPFDFFNRRGFSGGASD